MAVSWPPGPAGAYLDAVIASDEEVLMKRFPKTVSLFLLLAVLAFSTAGCASLASLPTPPDNAVQSTDPGDPALQL